MNVASFHICIPGDHASFDGHFPGHPILPGAALLDLIVDLAASGPKLRIISFRSAKFLQPIEPDTHLQIEFHGIDATHARFTCQASGKTVATGVAQFDCLC